MLKNITPKLPEFGKIKAGMKEEEPTVSSKTGKKFHRGMKLDHYLVTETERDSKGINFKHDKALMKSLKKDKSLIDSNGNLVSIPIRLLYNDINLNLYYRNACYVGYKRVCSSVDDKTAKTRDGREVPCPCKKVEPRYEGDDICKVNGKLSVIIDGANVVGACHVLRTTGRNTVESLIGGMSLIQARTGGLLAFLPLHLTLKPMTTTTPGGEVRTVYISSITFRGNLDDLYKKAIAMAKDKAQFLIEMDSIEEQARKMQALSVETEQDVKDMQEEFYSKGVDAEVKEVKPESEKETEKEPEQMKAETEADPPDEDIPFDSDTSEQSADVLPGEVEAPARMVNTDQKKQIVKLKKNYKIVKPEAWAKLLEPFEVKTANDLTFDQAEKFIKSLATNPT